MVDKETMTAELAAAQCRCGHFAERVGEQDPAYADAFVQALSRLAAAVRTALHPQDDSP